MDVVTGKAIAFRHRRMNYFFGCLAFMTDGAELFSLANETERSLLVGMRFTGRPMAGNAIIGSNRAVNKLLPYLAFVAPGSAAVGKAWQAVRPTSGTACQKPGEK